MSSLAEARERGQAVQSINQLQPTDSRVQCVSDISRLFEPLSIELNLSQPKAKRLALRAHWCIKSRYNNLAFWSWLYILLFCWRDRSRSSQTVRERGAGTAAPTNQKILNAAQLPCMVCALHKHYALVHSLLSRVKGLGVLLRNVMCCKFVNTAPTAAQISTHHLTKLDATTCRPEATRCVALDS